MISVLWFYLSAFALSHWISGFSLCTCARVCVLRACFHCTPHESKLWLFTLCIVEQRNSLSFATAWCGFDFLQPLLTVSHKIRMWLVAIPHFLNAYSKLVSLQMFVTEITFDWSGRHMWVRWCIRMWGKTLIYTHAFWFAQTRARVQKHNAHTSDTRSVDCGPRRMYPRPERTKGFARGQIKAPRNCYAHPTCKRKGLMNFCNTNTIACTISSIFSILSKKVCMCASTSMMYLHVWLHACTLCAELWKCTVVVLSWLCLRLFISFGNVDIAFTSVDSTLHANVLHIICTHTGECSSR